MCAWNKTGDIKKFYRDGSPSLDAATIVGLAAVGKVEARAGAFDLEVANGALGIDSREWKVTDFGGSICQTV
jgi:hypothetical protein